jgi:hypothetical protein
MPRGHSRVQKPGALNVKVLIRTLSPNRSVALDPVQLQLTGLDASAGFDFLENGLQAGLELSFGAGFAFSFGVFSVVFNRTAVKICSF